LNTKNKTIIQYYYKHGWKVVRPWPDRPYRRLRPCNRYQVKWLTLIVTRAVIQIENKTNRIVYTYT